MKKNYLFLIFAFIFAINANSQVTIGSSDAPVDGAALELKSDTLGFLPTRVYLESLNLPDPLPDHVNGMLVYNLTVSDAENLQVGYYYNTGTEWVRLSPTPFGSKNWFYMPSIVFDTSKLTAGPDEQVDLYGAFKSQLNDDTNPNVVASAGAPSMALATVPASTDLYYYVTAYDDEVFNITGITADGKLSYRVINPATDETFINIVFVEK